MIPTGKRILITGATGFIGANLVRRCLDLSADVYIFTRDTSNKWRINDILKYVKDHHVDLLNYGKLEKSILEIKPEVILHTTTYGGYPFQKEEDRIINTNTIGTINLVNACSKVGFDIFVNTGSSSEYGLKDKPMSEIDLLEPINIYGIAKSSATLFCQMKAKSENLPIAILRPFSPYGYYEGSTRLISSVIIACLRKKNPELSSPDLVRDFIFIDDVIDSYIKTVENKDKSVGEMFNVGSGKQHSLGEVVDEIIKLIGNKVIPQWKKVPNPRVEPKMWQANISKAERLLNWQPKHDLTQGLRKTVNWFEKNIFLYEKNGL